MTGNLINFDVDDGPVKRYQLMHEMTHVWQNQNVGPIYMAHAVFDQITLGQEAAYNYGYDNDNTGITLANSVYDGTSRAEPIGAIIGKNGEAALNATNDFMTFGPEQQGQIMMQWFVRKVLLNQSDATVAPWQKFVTWVQTHPQVA